MIDSRLKPTIDYAFNILISDDIGAVQQPLKRASLGLK